MRKSSLLLGLALVGFPSQAFAQEMGGQEMAHEEHEMMVEEVTEAVTARSAEFAEAYTSGDVDAIAAFYTDDARVMPPGKEAQEGRAAIRAGIAQDLAQMEGMEMSFETIEVIPAHHGALEVGGYTLEGADGSHVDHGKYMVAWERTDDGWKIALDIWNSSMGGQ